MLTLKKNNLCIRSIIANSAKKGSAAKKKKNREISNLLWNWEKEAENLPNDFDGDVSEGLEEIDSVSCSRETNVS